MKKVKRVVLGEGKLGVWCGFGQWDPWGVNVDTGIRVNRHHAGRRGRLVFEITEPKRKRKGTT